MFNDSVPVKTSILALDIDGTLISSEVVHPDMIKALGLLRNQLINGRVELVFNTARLLPMALPILEQLHTVLSSCTVYLVTDLGGRLSEVNFTNDPMNKMIIHDIQHTPLSEAAIMQIVFKVIQKDTIINFYSSVDNRIHTFTSDENINDADKIRYVRAPQFIEVVSYNTEDLPHLLDIISFLQPSMINVERDFNEDALRDLHLAEYRPGRKASITPVKVTKASGIEKLKIYRELKQTYIIAAGDAEPDKAVFGMADEVIIVGDKLIPGGTYRVSHAVANSEHLALFLENLVKKSLSENKA